MKFKDIVGKYKTVSFKKGTRLTVAIAAMLAAVICINIAVGLIPTRYTRLDTSSQGLFSVSDQTKIILKGLSADVSIYHLCTGGIEDDNISELLLKYSSLSDRLSVSVIDTSLYPNFYLDYTEEAPSDNSVIVSCGKKVRVIDYYEIYTASTSEYAYYGYYDVFNGETELTSALDYVTAESLPKIYMLKGHSESEPSEELQEEIFKQNFELEELSLAALTEIPEDAACVMLFSPERDISEAEMSMLLSYREKGGSLLLLTDYGKEDTPVFDSMLGKFGLSVAGGLVFEGDANKYIASYPYYIYPELVSHEVTSPLISQKLNILFPLACGITLSESEDTAFSVDPLIATSDLAYSKLDINSQRLERTDDDITGPFSLGVSVTDGAGRMIVFSSTQFLDSNINKSVAGANYDLFLNSLGWLCQKESAVSVHPKTLTPTSIAVGSLASSIMFVILVVAVPGIFIITAVVTVRRRRQR